MIKSLILDFKVRRILAELKKQDCNTNFFTVWGHTNVFDCYTFEDWVNTWYAGLFKKKITADELKKHVRVVGFSCL